MGRSTSVAGAFAVAWMMVAAASISAQNPGGSPEARKVKNPVAATAASIKTGAQLFAKNCQFCHGETGKGDGPLVPKDMKPANLTDATWDRGSTDGEIFAVIANGAGPEFKMKGVKGRLSDTEIWHLVNFIRSLVAGKPAGANPWQANSLEWCTTSPAPHGNFGEEIPTVHRGPYEFASPGVEEDYLPQWRDDVLKEKFA